MRKSTFLLLFFVFSLFSLVHVVFADNLTIKQATLPYPLSENDCTENSLTHKIYCFGGGFGSGSINRIIEYDPIIDNVSFMTAQFPGWIQNTACAEDSSSHIIYCFGGRPNYIQIFAYDSVTDILTLMNARLPSPRSNMACAEDSSTHKIYCFGGYDTRSISQIIEYTPQTDTLQTKSAAFSFGLLNLACTEFVQSHKIYCFGGSDGSALDQIVEYTPSTDRLQIKNAVLPSRREALDCVSFPRARNIYCFGGYNNGALNQIISYSPLNDTVTIMPSTLPIARWYLSCASNSQSSYIYCLGGSPLTDKILEYSDNLPPLLDFIGNKTFFENETLLIQLQASDPENFPLTFSTDAGNVLPSPFSFNETSGFFNWTPTSRDQGNYTVTFSVTDGIYTVSETITIFVLDSPQFDFTLTGTSRIGDRVNISLVDSQHPFASYFILLAITGDKPGTKLSDGRIIPLNPDGLFYASLFYPLFLGLYGSQSRLDNFGEGEAYWIIPWEVGFFTGFDMYMAVITYDFSKSFPESILSISSAKKIMLFPRKFVSDQHTVALWDFNEGQGNTAKDLSNNGNDGDVRGATWVTGLEGSALQFDGLDDYVFVQDSSSLSPTTALTLEAWVRVDGPQRDSLTDHVLGKDHQYAFGIGDTLFTDNLSFAFINQPPALCDPSGWCDGGGPVPAQEWHHVAVQYDGSMMKTFLDGHVLQQYPASFTLTPSNIPLAIGARWIFLPQSGPMGFFKGTLDQVRISDIARY